MHAKTKKLVRQLLLFRVPIRVCECRIRFSEHFGQDLQFQSPKFLKKILFNRVFNYMIAYIRLLV